MSHISGVPVLLYHEISAEGALLRGDRFSVPVERFRAQVSLMSEAGSATLDQIRGGNARGNVGITFDDGLESDFAVALGVLKEKDLVAHFFINTANVGRAGYMSWAQIRELHRAGMHIGSHGHRHICLTEVTDDVLASELSRSRQILEDELQTSVSWFAAPYGLISPRVVRAAQQAGYTGICTSRCWPAREGGETTPRVAVSRDTSMRQFRALVQRKPMIYWRRNLAAAAKYVPRRVIVRVRPNILGVSVSRQPL